jgi:hypothetical protein
LQLFLDTDESIAKTCLYTFISRQSLEAFLETEVVSLKNYSWLLKVSWRLSEFSMIY